MDGHQAKVRTSSLRSNLINLPLLVCNLLFSAKIALQNVIVEVYLAGRGATPTKRYLGWTGMPSSDISSIDIDPQVSQQLGFKNGDDLIINIKLGSPEATNIALEPLTALDWELIELHAQTIEDNLLSQARCVSVGQHLVVFPSLTSSAKLVVTDIGLSESYAKINPYAEISIAPKVREKAAPPAKETKDKKQKAEDTPIVLKRGISLPHALFPGALDNNFQVFTDKATLPPQFGSFVVVQIVPGPEEKHTTKAPKDDSVTVRENKFIVAQIVDVPGQQQVGLSQRLAAALGVEFEVGYQVVLKPAPRPSPKRPTTVVVYPYQTQTKKVLTVNASKDREARQKIGQELAKYFEDIQVSSMPITNCTKLAPCPGLPRGGLLQFKKVDDPLMWLRPLAPEKLKQFKIEVAEEVLRPSSFITETEPSQRWLQNKVMETGIGLDKCIDLMVDTFIGLANVGTLVYGKLGAGKTLVLNMVAHELAEKHGYYIKYVSCETVMNDNFPTAKTAVFKWLQSCAWHKPAVLILDNLDKILSAEQEQGDNSKLIQLTEYFISQLEKIQSQRHLNILVLALASSKELLNKLLSQAHVLENFHHLSPPDKHMRADILNVYLNKTLGCKIKFDIMDMVTETEGYLANDLKILSDRLYQEGLYKSQDPHQVEVTKADLESCLKGYTPSNLRGVKLQKLGTNWSDIGGLQEAKNVLLETLEWPTKYAPIFSLCPLRLRLGILLYGYPGCGKTLLALAVAGQCGLNFISIKGPEILNKYIGASEALVRELFERAQAAKPCILFFDEFDSIAPKRGHDSTGVTDRVVNQMLTQMDGAEGLDGVYVLAATSRPDLIDSALLRPGRLDKLVICDMPNYDDRLDILRTITASMDLADDVKLEEIAHGTEGFSGADMQGLGYNAYLKAVHVKLAANEAKASEQKPNKDSNNYEFFQVNSEKQSQAKLRPADRVKIAGQIQQLLDKENQGENLKNTKEIADDQVVITHENFVELLLETKPSISVSERRKLQGIYHKFVLGRDGNMPDGSASNEIGGRTLLM